MVNFFSFTSVTTNMTEAFLLLKGEDKHIRKQLCGPQCSDGKRSHAS